LKPGRLISPPGTYFVAFSTHHRRKRFVLETYVRLFLHAVYRYRREGRYELHAFVVMPEHVHLLLTPARDVPIERSIQLIKGAYSHESERSSAAIRNSGSCGFTDHRIRIAVDFMHHQNYIHRNPVERHIVTDPSDYRYCSGFSGFKLDPWPPAAKAAHLRAS
jgi:putative transposase